MHVYSEIAVMVLVFMACWGGLALAKASQQREEAEGESLSRINPASSRMAATTLRSQVRRDVHSRYAARVAERSDPAIQGQVHRFARAGAYSIRQTSSGGDAA